MSSSRRASRRRGSAGFTLVELMAAIVIVGILATIAVYGVSKFIRSAKSTEAVNMIGSIRAAEESFKDETHTYLNVSTSITTFYPMLTPGANKHDWTVSGHTDFARWQTLGVRAAGPVQYGYAVVAGGPGDAMPEPSAQKTFAFGTPGKDWYLVQAVGDPNENGIQAVFVASSLTDEIYMENESE